MIGIIGGTGLYQINSLGEFKPRPMDTPFGKPSAQVLVGEKAAFLARHGEHHELLPHEINYRANIWALKSVGVRRIISISSVGSLQEDFQPGDIVLPDQYLDFTKGLRKHSFFGEGFLAHVSTAEPSCPALAEAFTEITREQKLRMHRPATYVCVEGPRLGTRAESFFFKNAGAHIVGMTAVPEAFLAREAELCYLSLSLVTDYDCWKVNEHVSAQAVTEQFKKNATKVMKILESFLSSFENLGACSCDSALEHAVIGSHNLT